jgi:hypothetical protein
MTFNELRKRRAPMTGAEAHDNIETMKNVTAICAQIKLLQMALGKFGNLTDEAREIYAKRLSELEQ